MSAEAVGYVFRCSPAEGATFAVHLAVADSVNDQYGNEFWMVVRELATKARCSRATAQRALKWLVENGLLDVCDGERREGAHTAIRYRFLLPDLPPIFDSRAARSRPSKVPHGEAPRSLTSAQEVPHGEAPALVDKPVRARSQANPSGADPDGSATDVDLLDPVDVLCDMLASKVQLHRGGARPPVTAKWRRDMRLLLERGPLHQTEAAPLQVEDVVGAMKAVFTWLAEPSSTGFCWADQVRSPHALRDHWHQMRLAARRARQQQQGRAATAIERSAHRDAGAPPAQAALSSGLDGPQPQGLFDVEEATDG